MTNREAGAAAALLHIGEALLSVASRALNFFVFGGSIHQTTSARAWIEGIDRVRSDGVLIRADPVWTKRRIRVDRLLFIQPDHCRLAWETEVENARRTLDWNEAAARQIGGKVND